MFIKEMELFLNKKMESANGYRRKIKKTGPQNFVIRKGTLHLQPQ
jgi:hypothetical protein